MLLFFRRTIKLLSYLRKHVNSKDFKFIKYTEFQTILQITRILLLMRDTKVNYSKRNNAGGAGHYLTKQECSLPTEPKSRDINKKSVHSQRATFSPDV